MDRVPRRRCLPSDSGIQVLGLGGGQQTKKKNRRSSMHAERPAVWRHVFAFYWSGVSTRPYHTVCPTPIPVACHPFVLRAAHTDLVRPLLFGSATFLAFRSFDDLLLRLSSVDLMPRLGLNSIHSTILWACLRFWRFGGLWFAASTRLEARGLGGLDWSRLHPKGLDRIGAVLIGVDSMRLDSSGCDRIRLDLVRLYSVRFDWI